MKKNIFLSACLISAFLSSQAQQTLSQRSDNELFNVGLELFDKKKYGAASEFFGQYIGLHKHDLRSIEAQYYKAYSDLQLFHPDAERQFKEFVTAHPDHPKAALAYFELGKFYYQQKNYPKVIEYFQLATPEKLSAAQQIEREFKLAYACLSEKDFEQAEKLFNRVKNSEHQYTASANYYAAYLNIKQQRYNEALIDLDKAEKNEAYAPTVPLMRANVYHKRKDFDKVIEIGEKALADTAKLVGTEEMSLLVGDAYYNKENYTKANQYFDVYLQSAKQPLAAPLQYRVAYALFRSGKTDKAIEAFKPLTQASQPDAESQPKDTLGQLANYYTGVAYLKAGNKSQALNAFDQARRNKAQSSVSEQAWFNYAKINYDAANYNEVIDILTVYLVKFPDSNNENEANEMLSESLLNSNNYDEALEHIGAIKKKTPRINAAFQRVSYLKGTQLYNENNLDNALQLFQKSLDNRIDNDITVAALFWLGEVYSAQKQYSDAIKQYEELMRVQGAVKSPYYLKMRYGLGYAFYNTKQYDKALIHFREYTNQLEKATAKQQYADALVRLADCYYIDKNYGQALKAYDKIIDRKDPESDYALYQKGLIFSASDRNDEAKKSFGTIIERYADSRFKDEATFQRAEIDLESGNYEAATSGFTAAIALNPKGSSVPYYYLKRAVAYSNLRQYDKSAADYKKILDEYPKHATANEALQGLQKVLTSAGTVDELNDYLTKYKNSNPEATDLENIEFDAAKGLYYSQKYDKAIKSLENFLNGYGQSGLAQEAKFLLAESYYRVGKRDKSIELHKELLSAKKNNTTNKSVMRLAELEYANANYKASQVYYNLLVNTASNKRELFNAWTGMMETYYQLANYDSVAYFAQTISAKDNAPIDAANKASLYAGKVAYAKGDYETATDELLNTANEAKDQYGAEAQYLLGEVFYKQKKYKESLQALYGVKDNFANYQKWNDKAYLLMADNFIAQNQYYQARATLSSIIENSPDNGTRDAAKQKLEQIKNKK
ncbi:Tetratricopeptide repeat-containing protein [Flexibacter flexilis DSM 6793]|uniref:Tetratricopeptide repeat-containing protein n=1 Tax=Flexibacter flexilis DSM 6793 TaxID=927664 RepID=A0A1I1FAC1_9BACT|nr:tetratricopeptide repeat protein [Flexibacter flexilis]SFB95896.1 Tetratricopeptide repeat-containing protein [Flexibacter flexilis DSM 6793]